MFRDFLYKSRYYLIILLVIFLICIVLDVAFINQINSLDKSVFLFVNENLVNDKATMFFKIITNLGGVLFFVIALILLLLFIKDKKCFSWTSATLIFTYLFSVVLKNFFRRERPLNSLIPKPYDFSFPSGHTMCSVAFYGFLIYLVNKKVKNKVLSITISVLLFLIFLLVSFSRLYLSVHFISDIVGGFILGVVCLLMFINYVRIKEIF